MGECPVCNKSSLETIYHVSSLPVLQLIHSATNPDGNDFSTFDLVGCSHCGHMHNRAFHPELEERMYGDVPLSNIPVHLSMINTLRDVINWVGVDFYQNKRVLEIGAGSGHVSRILAEKAKEVIVFEPCASLKQEMLPEKNIQWHQTFFTGDIPGGNVDLVICRQVIEHMENPFAFLKSIQQVINKGGLAYLEVPNAAYFTEHGSFGDFHLTHVQYFIESNFCALAAKAGFEVVRSFLLKNGHDLGVLFRTGKISHTSLNNVIDFQAVRSRLQLVIQQQSQIIATLSGRIGLYGANWSAQSYLCIFQDVLKCCMALDDNAVYQGFALYNKRQTLPIVLPTPELVNSLDAIIITAYLHDQVVAKKLRQYGFTGRLLSMRPQPIAQNDYQLEGICMGN